MTTVCSCDFNSKAEGPFSAAAPRRGRPPGMLASYS